MKTQPRRIKLTLDNLLKILFALMIFTLILFDMEIILANPLRSEFQIGVHMLPEAVALSILAYQARRKGISLKLLLSFTLLFVPSFLVVNGLIFQMPLRYYGNTITLLSTGCLVGLMAATFEELASPITANPKEGSRL